MAEIPEQGAVHKATVRYWKDGWAQMNDVPRWSGRGLSWELGVRAFHYQMQERPGQWPQTLIDHERMLDDFEEYAGG